MAKGSNAMASGRAPDNAVQDQIDATIMDGRDDGTFPLTFGNRDD